MANIKFTQLPDQGAVTDATILPSVASGTNYTVTAANLKTYVNSTTGNVTAGNLNITGNITDTAGSLQLTSTGAINLVPTTNVGITGALSATGNITGNYILGNGSQLTGLPATYGNSNVTTLLAGFGSNAISTTGNVTAGYVLGNGSLLTGITTSYNNSNVTALLAAFGSNAISTTGNVTASYHIGNGSLLTNITGANVTGNVGNAVHAYNADIATTSNYATNAGATTTATTAGTVTTAAQPNITSTGTLTTLSVTGNITSGANIAGSYFIGNGSQLTGIVATSTYGNANVAAYLPTYTGNLNPGNLTASGNVQGSYIKGNGALMTGLVTSIVAGTGISVNVSTGAVTITNTGGSGSGNSISSGFAFVNANATSGTGGNIVWMYNGNVSSSTNNWTGNTVVIQNAQGTKSSAIVLAPDGNINLSANTSSFINLGQNTTASAPFYVNYGAGTAQTLISGGTVTTNSVVANTITAINGTGTGLTVPVATAAVTRTYTGQAGSIRAVSDSPTYAGRMCYWSTTATAQWRYISDNSAV